MGLGIINPKLLIAVAISCKGDLTIEPVISSDGLESSES